MHVTPVYLSLTFTTSIHVKRIGILLICELYLISDTKFDTTQHSQARDLTSKCLEEVVILTDYSLNN